MVNSSLRKRALSGWLRKHNTKEFYSALKFQKFLFFYEGLSKVENDDREFRLLRGYKNGPVFGDVYGDYTHDYYEFVEASDYAYQNNPNIINGDRAKVASFLVKIMNYNELSLITHKFNIWNAKAGEILSGARNVPLREEDFNESDCQLLLTFKKMYPIEFIDSVTVLEIDGKSFVINKDDYRKLSDEQRSVFITLASEDELLNPVYVSISEDGVVLVD